MESSGKVTARWEVMLSKREVVEAVARAAMKKRGLMVPSQFKVEAYYEDGRIAFGEETWIEMFDGYTAIVMHTERIVKAAHVTEVFSNQEPCRRHVPSDEHPGECGKCGQPFWGR